jgi:hypothetical protein
MEYSDTLSISSADVLKEKGKLIEVLKIPISNLVFSRFYCELFESQQSIGFLSIIQSSIGIQYQVDKPSLQKLNWGKVYSLSHVELNEKIRKKIGIELFNVVPASFRRLYIEDLDNQLIASFDCIFENHSWTVHDEGILAFNLVEIR